MAAPRQETELLMPRPESFLFKLVQIAASRLDPNDGNLGQEQGLWGEADSNPGLF